MCRVDSAFCGLLSLEGGAILIAWLLMSVSTIFAATEMVNPWIYALYSLDNSKSLTRFFFGEFTALALASIFLLIAVHENRPVLCVVWTFIIACDIAANFALLIYLMPVEVPFAILYSEAVTVHVGILVYFIAIVMSYYREQTDESPSLTDLR